MMGLFGEKIKELFASVHRHLKYCLDALDKKSDKCNKCKG